MQVNNSSGIHKNSINKNKKQKNPNQTIVNYWKNVRRLATEELGFKFETLPRKVIQQADALARELQECQNQNNVISTLVS